jgi:hypothetical protein
MDSRITIAVASTVGGFTLGYLVNSKRLRNYYEKQMEEEVEKAHAHFRERQLELERELIAEQAETLNYAVKAERALAAQATYVGVEALEEAATDIANDEYLPSTLEVQARNGLLGREDFVPSQYTPELAPEEPLVSSEKKPKDREVYVDKSKPYLITTEDFLQNENNYTQATLTYYENGDTLTGENDEPLDDKSRLMLIGTHLSDFGAFGEDPNAVYIRNDAIHMDLEVVKNESNYSEVVGLGGDG